jgi:hypothetical protein
MEAPMSFDPTRAYSFVRGFNFQPDWSSNGLGLWLRFDANRYRDMIVHAKQLFPGMNTLRIWLSLDAWCEDSALYLRNIREAATILAEEGMRFIPVYFNGWFGLPSFGGFVSETLSWARDNNHFMHYRAFLRQSAEAIASDAILIQDVSNEPFNNAWGLKWRTELVWDFMREMVAELRSVSSLPITVGSQGLPMASDMGIAAIKGEFGDIDLLAPYVDVITLHPYCIPPMTKEEHLHYLTRVLAYLTPYHKPVIITECCWAGRTDEERIPFLQTELSHYAQLGLGFCAHALWESPVADLHRLEDGIGIGTGLYMAFIDKSGAIRKGHELFNAV